MFLDMGAYPKIVTLYGYHMLMQVSTLNILLGDRVPIWQRNNITLS